MKNEFQMILNCLEISLRLFKQNRMLIAKGFYDILDKIYR